DIENLRLAWVKASQRLLAESLVDEIEIRIFEKDLDANLILMQQQMNAYANNVAQADDYIFYKLPKNSSTTRPRGLSHIEAELLSVAIIQKLGAKESQLRRASYAYRLAGQSRGRDTEYLYAPWLDAHKKFIADARSEAQKHQDCFVIRVDIRS